jgi:hypothetical protein
MEEIGGGSHQYSEGKCSACGKFRALSYDLWRLSRNRGGAESHVLAHVIIRSYGLLGACVAYMNSS